MARKKILIVEDEPSIADNIAYALSTEGFEPLPCGTGAEAREIMATGGDEGVALIILDIGLPDVSGFELLTELRGNYDTPLIVVTARSSEVDRIVGLEVGADDYVVKPFSPRELTARVKTVLRRTQGGPGRRPGSQDIASGTEEAPEQTHSPFTVDDARKKVLFHGAELELSRYEYRLLTLLAGNPGRVYTREHLMSLLWEEPEMSMDRTVDTHIKTIRRKLKAVRPDEEYIVTHRGVGYSLKETV